MKRFLLLILALLLQFAETKSQNQLLIPFRKDTLWGFADFQKNIVIPCIYEETQFFINDLAKVKKKGLWGAIDKLGNLFLPCAYNILYCGSKNGRVIVATYKNQNSKNGLWGFTSQYKNQEIKLEYDLIRETGLTGLLGVCKNGLWGCINPKGKLIIPIMYEVELLQHHQFDKNLYPSAEIKALQIEIEKEPYLKLRFEEGLAKVKKGGKWGFLNQYGNPAIPLEYDFVGEFAQGLVCAILVKDNFRKVGFINAKNEVIIPFDYDLDYANYKNVQFSEGLAQVNKNRKIGFINTKNKLKIPFQFGIAHHFVNDRAIVSYESQVLDAQYLVIDKQGNELFKIPKNYTLLDFSFKNECIRVQNEEGNVFLIDKNGKQIGKEIYHQIKPFEKGIAQVSKKQANQMKIGFVDTKGNEIIPVLYDELKHQQPQMILDFIKIRKDDKIGVISLKNEQIIPFEYEDLQMPYFADKNKMDNILVAVCKNKQWGFINVKNEIIILLKYEKVYDFVGDFAAVLCKGKLGYINRRGEEFWED